MPVMLKHTVMITLLLGWLHGPAPDVLKNNQYVGIEVAVSSQTVKSGESAEIRLQFLPADGIHINATPAIEFTLDSSDVFVLKGRAIQQSDALTGFLSTSVPVRQLVGIAPKASTGVQSLRGTLVYYYCSDVEGWCMRFRQRVELPIMITE